PTPAVCPAICSFGVGSVSVTASVPSDTLFVRRNIGSVSETTPLICTLLAPPSATSVGTGSWRTTALALAYWLGGARAGGLAMVFGGGTAGPQAAIDVGAPSVNAGEFRFISAPDVAMAPSIRG